MIFFYGDSHAEFSFRYLDLPHINRRNYAITMHRIGRDNIIINYNLAEVTKNDIVCISYGEIDCRCHIQKQIDAGRNEDTIIYELVHAYFKAIKDNIKEYKKIIIVAVIPPLKYKDFLLTNNPKQEYPIVGSDENRVRFRIKMNKLIEELCVEYGYIYFNPYEDYYMNADGTLKYELSDKNVHIGREHTTYILEKFKIVIDHI